MDGLHEIADGNKMKLLEKILEFVIGACDDFIFRPEAWNSLDFRIGPEAIRRNQRMAVICEGGLVTGAASTISDSRPGEALRN